MLTSHAPATRLRTLCKASRRAPALVAVLTVIAALTGCRQDMHNQPKFFPQRGTSLFADGRSVRAQVTGTVARSQGPHGDYLNTGLIGSAEGDGMPMPVTLELLARGQERYNVFCTPCHSRTGFGHGMIVQRGYHPAASLHTERLRQAPLGHFFFVISNGYGAMPDYAAQLSVPDRWAIVAYIRALQLSQHAKQTDAAGGGGGIARISQVAEQHGYQPGFADTGFWQERPRTRAAATPTVATPASAPQPLATEATPAGTTAQAKASESPEAAAPKPATHTADIAAGHQVYDDNCAMCHQPNLVGKPPRIPGLLGVVPRSGEEHVRDVIANGMLETRPIMPAFGDRLSPEEIDRLVAFLKAQKDGQ